MGLTSRLNSYIDVYGKVKCTNELGEDDYKYDIIKKVWAELIPGNGNLKSGIGNTEHADISHKITVRSNSIPNLTNDMYFIFKGQRYDIKYFNPNYKHRDRIEIMCNLVVE